MLRNGLARILVVDCDAAQRRSVVSALREVSFRVWETADTTVAISIVHKSPSPLVVVVEASCSHVLRLAATDRRLVHHHAYILLQPGDTATTEEWTWPYMYLNLRILASPPDRQALLTAVAQAQRALGVTAIR
jgi:DNA-binding NtrC family response regulator